jgi:hypothetical protein
VHPFPRNLLECAALCVSFSVCRLSFRPLILLSNAYSSSVLGTGSKSYSQ